MKAIGHFFGTVLTIILVLNSLICLFIFTVLNSTKNILSTDIVTDIIKKIDFKELIGEEAQKEIYYILEQTGIPNEYVNYVLENEELKEYMGNYITEGLNYILYEKDPIIISEQEIINLFSNSFDQVIMKLENHNIEVSTHLTKEQQKQIHEKIEIYVPQIVEKIPEVENLIEDKINQNNELQDARQKLEQLREINRKIEFMYKLQWKILLLAIFQLMVIIILKRKNFHFIKWLFLPFMSLTVIFKLLTVKIPSLILQYYPEKIGFMKSYINSILDSILKVWKQYIQIYSILAIILIILQILVIYNKRKKIGDLN